MKKPVSTERLAPVVYPSHDDVVYAAGILDGEGSVSIIRQPPRRNNRLAEDRPNVTIGSTTLSMLQWCQERWGGRIYLSSRRINKPMWYWQVCVKNAIQTFLRQVRPHLQIKGQQVWLLLEALATTKLVKGGRGRPVPPEEEALREGFYLAMWEANHG